MAVTTARRPKFRTVFFALHALTAAAALFFVLQAPRLFAPRADKPADYGEVPDFTLVDQNGKIAKRDAFSGRPWVADFIYTRCQGQCLVMNAQARDLGAQLAGVPIVSFTADPAHDTPAVLAKYAAQAAGGESGRIFLTGDYETLDRVAKGLHMNGLDEPMMHSVRFVLIDKNHRIRGYYDANDPASIEKLKQDAASLLGHPLSVI